MLYNFSNLEQQLTRLGYPVATESGFRVIKRDLTEEAKAGNIDFRGDGIYLKVDGKEYKGYMYLKRPDIQKWGIPKFHITNCDKVLEQRQNGRFDGHYFWHNSNVVTLTDRSTKVVHENVVLSLCRYCQSIATDVTYQNTEGFFSELDRQEIADTASNIELDMFGRPLNWATISKEYRQEKKYTCEKCGFGGEMLENTMDRVFLETDHIIPWELTNIKRRNLQCLCILCHSQKDEVHRKNFAKSGNQKKLKRFIDKYKQQLEEVGNEYLNLYSN